MIFAEMKPDGSFKPCMDFRKGIAALIITFLVFLVSCQPAIADEWDAPEMSPETLEYIEEISEAKYQEGMSDGYEEGYDDGKYRRTPTMFAPVIRPLFFGLSMYSYRSHYDPFYTPMYDHGHNRAYLATPAYSNRTTIINNTTVVNKNGKRVKKSPNKGTKSPKKGTVKSAVKKVGKKSKDVAKKSVKAIKKAPGKVKKRLKKIKKKVVKKVAKIKKKRAAKKVQKVVKRAKKQAKRRK